MNVRLGHLDRKPGLLRRLARALVAAIRYFVQGLLILWSSLAIYYSNLPLGWLRLCAAIAFAVFGIWALWRARTGRAYSVYGLAFCVVVLWHLSIAPSHDRQWRPEVAIMPRAHIDGDRVRLTGVRNFTYRSTEDFTPRYEEREVLLSHLQTVDLYISYWMPGPVGHTFVSFVFDNAPPVSISIEARPELGEGYDPIASMFKQFELIYVVGDERDLVRVRTDFRHEDVYLFKVRMSPEHVRELFMIYLDRMNQLADRPEWYRLLSNSCTINIVRYANKIDPFSRFDIRHYLNGLFDSYLYDRGNLDTSLPLDELRRRSHINEVARAAGDAPDFSARIRASLPPRHP